MYFLGFFSYLINTLGIYIETKFISTLFGMGRNTEIGCLHARQVLEHWAIYPPGDINYFKQSLPFPQNWTLSQAVVTHAFHPSTREVEAGRSLWVKVSLVYKFSSGPSGLFCLRKTNKQTSTNQSRTSNPVLLPGLPSSSRLNDWYLYNISLDS